MFLEWQALVLMSFQWINIIKDYIRIIIKINIFYISDYRFFYINNSRSIINDIWIWNAIFSSPLRIITQEGIDEINGWLTLKGFK